MRTGVTAAAPHAVSHQKSEKFCILIYGAWNVIHNPYATSCSTTRKCASCILQYRCWAIRTVRHQVHENIPIIHLSCPRGRGSHSITRHSCPLLTRLYTGRSRLSINCTSSSLSSFTAQTYSIDLPSTCPYRAEFRPAPCRNTLNSSVPSLEKGVSIPSEAVAFG